MNAGDKPRVEVLAVPSKVLMAMPGTLGTREYGDAEAGDEANVGTFGFCLSSFSRIAQVLASTQGCSTNGDIFFFAWEYCSVEDDGRKHKLRVLHFGDIMKINRLSKNKD